MLGEPVPELDPEPVLVPWPLVWLVVWLVVWPPVGPPGVIVLGSLDVLLVPASPEPPLVTLTDGPHPKPTTSPNPNHRVTGRSIPEGPR